MLSLLGSRACAASGNDAFADRVPLSGASVSAVSSAIPATRESGEPDHGGNYYGGSLWWSWVAPSTGLASFNAFGSEADSRPYFLPPSLAVYSGSAFPALTEIGSAVSASSSSLAFGSAFTDPGIFLTVPVTAGQTYQIAFAGSLGRSTFVALNINRAPTFISGATASAALGSAFSHQVAASGNPTGFTASGLPSGLVFNPFTGRISGTPLQTGVFLIPLDASNAAGTGSATLTLTVNASSPPVPVTPLSFFGAAATSGTVGVSFTYSLSVSGGPATYSLSGLPPGLSFDGSSATISGVPSAAGVFQVTVAATNATETIDAIVTIYIATTLPPPVISSYAGANGTVGTSFSYTISASNSPTSRSASGLPPGLTISASTGSISGTPTTAGTFAVPISATNSGGTGTAVLTIVIAPPSTPASILQITSSATASGVVGTSFTYGIAAGSGATSFTAAGLPPGLSVNAQTGSISGVPTTAGVFLSSLTASDGNATVGATVQFTIAATAATAPALSSSVITSSAGATGIVGTSFFYRISAGSSSFSQTYAASGLPPGLTLGGSFGDTISGTPTTAGTYPVNLTVNFSVGGGLPATRATAVLTIRVLSTPPAPTNAPLITSIASSLGTTGTSFSYSIAADASPTGYSASGLPAGLSVNATTGAISGTPTVAGVFPVTVSATNAIGTGTATLIFTIAATPSPPIITSNLALSGTVGVAISSYSLSSTPNATSYSVGALPPGLSFSTSTISGTPTAAGIFSVPISATNAGGTTNAVVTITIAAARPAPVISSSIAASGIVGSPFSYFVDASNSPTSYAAGSLPAGLSFNAGAGQIFGTPTVAGTFPVNISATNGGGTGTATVTITIAAAGPAPVVSNSATAIATVGSPFSFSIFASNSPTSYAASNLPAGLTLNTVSGTISGTPTVAGVFSVPISAMNSGGTANATLTITVANPTAPLPPVISSAAAARGIVGAPFSHTLSASNSPTNFTATGLPAGLSVDAASGAISGTPTAAGTATVAISATNSGGTTNATLTIDISVAPLDPPVITSSAGATGQIGDPFYYAVTATNLPTTFAATGLPAGLVFDAATGIISGTPTSTTTATVALTATNALGSGTASLRIAMVPNSSTVQRISSAAAAAGTVGSAFNYAITATRSPSSYSASGMPAGLTLNSSTGIISGTPAAAGTFTVTISANTSGGTASGTLKIIIGAAAPNVPIISSPAGMNAYFADVFGYRITASNGPTSFAATGLPAGLLVNATTGWITGIPTASGTFTVALSATNGSGAGTATLKIVVASSPLASRISSSAAAIGIVGVPFAYTLTANGSLFSSNATSLPAGLAYNSSTRQITGTPASAGVFAVSLSASTSPGTAFGTLSLTILSEPQATPVLSSAASSLGYVATDFTYTISATNKPTAFAATNLPAGLALNPATGAISGRPTVSGIFTVPISATNAIGQSQATLTFTIGAVPPAPRITNAAALTKTLGASGALATITATNNPTQFTAVGLPPGLSLDTASGAISGTATTVGVYAAQVSASNAGGTATATIMFTIALPPAPDFYGSAVGSGFVGVSFSGSAFASNSPTNFSASGLPAGLAISATSGSISGTPTVAGTFPVQVSATNAGGTASAIYTVVIASAPPLPTITSGQVSATGEIGVAFPFYSFNANGTTSIPVTYSAAGLPPGLVCSTSGSISGTPTASGTFTATVSATNSAGITSAQLTIIITPRAAPAITSAAGANGILNQTFSYTLVGSHVPASFSAGGLPPGLSLNAATGTISGVPTALGDYLVPVAATNSAGTGSAQIRIRILANSTAIPVITSAASATYLSGNSSSSNPNTIFSQTIAGAGFPTSFTATNLPPGLTLNPWSGEVSGRPSVAGSFQVPISATGFNGTATATLTIVVPLSTPAFSMAASVIGHVGTSMYLHIGSSPGFAFPSSSAPPYSDTYSASGLPPGLSIDASGYITGRPAVAGTFLATIFASNIAGTASAPLTVLIDDIPPAPTAPQFSSGYAATISALNLSFSQDFWFSGTPASITASGLPPGLSLSTPQGTYNGEPTILARISGTPSMSGTFPVSISAQNATGSASVVTTIIVAANAPVPIIADGAVARGTVGVSFFDSIYLASDSTAFGTPVAYSASNLPAGLTLDPATGFIQGTPQSAGSFAVPVSATRGGITGNAVVTFIIAPQPAPSATAPNLSVAAGALGFVGVPFQIKATATGATDLTVSALPPGLSAEIGSGTSNGAAARFATLQGFPTTPGTFTISMSATNALGASTAVLTITIIAPQAALPFLTQWPVDQTATDGQTVVFTGSAIGMPAPTFQWLRDGIAIPGATSSTLSLPNITPADAGGYTFVASNGSGGATSAPAVLTVATSYDVWESTRFSPAEIATGFGEPNADANADGIANLLEYAFARDPHTGAGSALPVVSRTGSGGRLRIQFTRDPSRVDLDYVVELSNDLSAWTPIASSHAGASVTGIGAAATVTESGGVLKNAVVEDAQNPQALPERFLRLRITRP